MFFFEISRKYFSNDSVLKAIIHCLGFWYRSLKCNKLFFILFKVDSDGSESSRAICNIKRDVDSGKVDLSVRMPNIKVFSGKHLNFLKIKPRHVYIKFK